MNVVRDFKQERNFKAFVLTLIATVTLFAMSVAMFSIITLSGHASADSGATYTGIAPTYAETVASNRSVDTAGLMLFNESNLKGALK